MVKRVILIFAVCILIVNIINVDGHSTSNPGLERVGQGGGGGVTESQGHQRFIVVLVNPSTNRFTFTKQEVLDFVARGENSVANFWYKNSYGQLQIVGADGGAFNEDDIFGPYVIDIPRDERCANDYLPRLIFNSFSGQIPFSDGLNVVIISTGFCGTQSGSNSGILIDFGENNQLKLSFAIILGESSRRLTFYTVAHEIGHMFTGAGHARYALCSPSSSQVPEECEQIAEYGSFFDVMGNAFDPGQSNAQTLERAGWLSEYPNAEHKILNVRQNGAYILKSLSSNEPGLKALKIPHGLIQTTEENIPSFLPNIPLFLNVEWHTPIGLDSRISAQYSAQETNIFDGALLHIDRGGSISTLFHPLSFGDDLTCVLYQYSPTICPRRLKTALLYGKSYIDPATGTKITIGERGVDGLPVSVDLGRTDFEPPIINEINIVETSDPCEAIIEANVFDESGISKVEFYKSHTGLISKIGEDAEAPFQLTYNFISSSFYTPIFIKVYDDAKREGGIMPDNYAVSDIFRISPIKQCERLPPEIVINSPYFNEEIDTKSLDPVDFFIDEDDESIVVHRVFYYEFPFFVKRPFIFNVKTYSNTPLMSSSIDELLSDFVSLEDVIGPNRFRINQMNFDAVVYPIVNYVYDSSRNYVMDIGEGVHYFVLNVVNQVGSNSAIYFSLNVLPPTPFIRGDVNSDGLVNLPDAIRSLNYLYRGGESPKCLDSADANDDGRIDITDAIYILGYLFRGDPQRLAEPSRIAGIDNTIDELITC